MEYELIAEGNANRILRRPDGSVIRVSKHGVDPVLVHNYMQEFWKPKLGAYICNTKPILNDPCYGSALCIDEIGSVVNAQELVAQFKPKWLVQSPSAPANAKCCRTCAIKTMRKQPLRWCSLDLAAQDKTGIAALAKDVARPGLEEQVACLLSTSNIFPLLAEWQARLQNEMHHCMSLRDCTVMIEADAGSLSNFRVYVVDLDPKSASDKMQKWLQLEHDLQPYYLEESRICRLSRK